MFKFNLREKEKVIRLYRQTEVVLFKPTLAVFVLIYAPWYFLLQYDLASDYRRLLVFWTLLVLLYALHKFSLWLVNAYILTNQRLVIVYYKNLLDKKVWETPLHQILNVSFSVKGFWQSLFKFGTVEVRVRGLPTEPLILKNVLHPAEAKDFIWKMRDNFPFSDIVVNHGNTKI